MAGFIPAIHVFASQERKTWMPGTRPGMTSGVLWIGSSPWNRTSRCALLAFGASAAKGMHMSLGLILVIILIIFLLGGFSGRFGGYGYGMGHSGMGLGGLILVVLLVLLLLGKL
jgi:Protein of unknown function (DUF3309)